MKQHETNNKSGREKRTKKKNNKMRCCSIYVPVNHTLIGMCVCFLFNLFLSFTPFHLSFYVIFNGLFHRLAEALDTNFGECCSFALSPWCPATILIVSQISQNKEPKWLEKGHERQNLLQNSERFFLSKTRIKRAIDITIGFDYQNLE